MARRRGFDSPHLHQARIAQPGEERLTTNQEVGGSSPSAGTMDNPITRKKSRAVSRSATQFVVTCPRCGYSNMYSTRKRCKDALYKHQHSGRCGQHHGGWWRTTKPDLP